MVMRQPGCQAVNLGRRPSTFTIHCLTLNPPGVAHSDRAGFVVSLKDSLDPCKFGIFSDESGFVYEKAPLSAPLIARQIR